MDRPCLYTPYGVVTLTTSHYVMLLNQEMCVSATTKGHKFPVALLVPQVMCCEEVVVISCIFMRPDWFLSNTSCSKVIKYYHLVNDFVSFHGGMVHCQAASVNFAIRLCQFEMPPDNSVT